MDLVPLRGVRGHLGLLPGGLLRRELRVVVPQRGLQLGEAGGLLVAVGLAAVLKMNIEKSRITLLIEYSFLFSMCTLCKKKIGVQYHY